MPKSYYKICSGTLYVIPGSSNAGDLTYDSNTDVVLVDNGGTKIHEEKLATIDTCELDVAKEQCLCTDSGCLNAKCETKGSECVIKIGATGVDALSTSDAIRTDGDLNVVTEISGSVTFKAKPTFNVLKSGTVDSKDLGNCAAPNILITNTCEGNQGGFIKKKCEIYVEHG